MNTSNVVPCSNCGTPADFFTKPMGPFCSVRCQMVDLDRWFSEDYRISEPLCPDHFSGYEHELGGVAENAEGETLDR